MVGRSISPEPGSAILSASTPEPGSTILSASNETACVSVTIKQNVFQYSVDTTASTHPRTNHSVYNLNMISTLLAWCIYKLYELVIFGLLACCIQLVNLSFFASRLASYKMSEVSILTDFNF
jgi:hypothetical protein